MQRLSGPHVPPFGEMELSLTRRSWYLCSRSTAMTNHGGLSRQSSTPLLLAPPLTNTAAGATCLTEDTQWRACSELKRPCAPGFRLCPICIKRYVIQGYVGCGMEICACVCVCASWRGKKHRDAEEKDTVADLQALDSSDLAPFCFLFPRPSCLSLFFFRNDKNDGFSIGASATFFSVMVGVGLRE